MNWVLFILRSALVFLLTFLLLGPILRQVNNIFEKPLFIFLYDDSESIKKTTTASVLTQLDRELNTLRDKLLEEGYDVTKTNLAGEDIQSINFNATTSDLNAALKRIENRYEGRNIAGVVLPSDGIYNSGLSPLYGVYNFPIYTIGVGDSSERSDLVIKNVAYNKIAYQGNKFPIRVDVLAKGITSQNIQVNLSRQGKIVASQTSNSASSTLLTFDFEVTADDQGMQKLDVNVSALKNEHNRTNNHASIFVDVVEGKKKILLVAPSPHPDIKALREVIGKNSNYEFLLHIPGVSEQSGANLKPFEIDLAIFLQSPDVKGRTRELFQLFASSKTPLLLQLGQQTDLNALARQNMPVKFASIPRDYDDVTPAINPAFSNFILLPEHSAMVADFPPIAVHFGKIQIPLSATPLLFQRVGSVITDKPLIAVDVQQTRKIGIVLGEGIWRWRLNEFDRSENTVAFDDLFGKLIQYLTTTDDKRRFRSYPTQNEFSDAEPVIFESQVYNDIVEPVYGNTIDLDITDDGGKRRQYSYVTSPGNTRYTVGSLKEGVYRYKARTTLNGKQEEVKGQFIVVERQTELQTLTADFDLLRKLSVSTGGEFSLSHQAKNLTTVLQKKEAKSVIHSEEIFDSLINLKWFFFVLLTLVSLEWFLRKFLGMY